MTKTANQIARLGHEHLDEVTDMLMRAFEGDPLMEYLFPGNSAESRHALMRFSCLVRFELKWPLLRFFESGHIVGKGCAHRIPLHSSLIKNSSLNHMKAKFVHAPARFVLMMF